MQDKTKALNLRINETVYERLDTFCRACGMTKRKAVEKAIADFVEKNQLLLGICSGEEQYHRCFQHRLMQVVQDLM